MLISPDRHPLQIPHINLKLKLLWPPCVVCPRGIKFGSFTSGQSGLDAFADAKTPLEDLDVSANRGIGSDALKIIASASGAERYFYLALAPFLLNSQCLNVSATEHHVT